MMGERGERKREKEGEREEDGKERRNATTFLGAAASLLQSSFVRVVYTVQSFAHHRMPARRTLCTHRTHHACQSN